MYFVHLFNWAREFLSLLSIDAFCTSISHRTHWQDFFSFLFFRKRMRERSKESSFSLSLVKWFIAIECVWLAGWRDGWILWNVLFNTPRILQCFSRSCKVHNSKQHELRAKKGTKRDEHVDDFVQCKGSTLLKTHPSCPHFSCFLSSLMCLRSCAFCNCKKTPSSYSFQLLLLSCACDVWECPMGKKFALSWIRISLTLGGGERERRSDMTMTRRMMMMIIIKTNNRSEKSVCSAKAINRMWFPFPFM